jgi:4a-hydroxytetrahydrobiopterin dehydratase
VVQPTETHDEPRQRFHLDVHLPHDQAEARIAAALEAGGHLVTDVPAPSFWILADAEGNKACICRGVIERPRRTGQAGPL